MPTWPASLPQKPASGGWSGAPQGNSVSFTPEIGDTIVRRRGSAVSHIYSGRFAAMTAAQLNIFKAFYEDTLFDGTTTFDWVDPIFEDDAIWRFDLSNGPGYSISESAPNIYDIAVSLIRVPG